MNDLYDLRELFSFFIRKIGIVIICVFVGAFAFAGVRFVELIPQYLQNRDETAEISSETEYEEPFYYEVSVLVRVEPTYEQSGNESQDMTKYIVSSYIANQKNEKVFEQLQEEYFELEEVENDRRKENLYAYGYILDKERSNPYTSYDFEKQMIVTTKTNEISSENYIRIGFESTNCDNARMIAEAYEKLLTEVVKEQVGDFEYEIEGESVSRRLPTASQGANASRTKTNSVSVAGSGVSLNYVVKQVAKGVVWGSLLGFFFALIIVALWYFLSGKIQRISEAEKFEIEFLGTYTGNQKKKIHNLIVKISNWVEGEKRLFKTSNEIVEILSGRCNLENLEESILVSGTGNLENINSFAKDLDEKTKGQVCAMPYVLSSKETIDACKWIKRVILVEELGFASKK